MRQLIRGGDTLELNGSRVVIITSGERLVEVWEDGSRFDPDAVISMHNDTPPFSSDITGITYRRKAPPS